MRLDLDNVSGLIHRFNLQGSGNLETFLLIPGLFFSLRSHWM